MAAGPFSFYGWDEIVTPSLWRALDWGYTQNKRYAVKLYGKLGLNPILLNGLLDDFACTCGRHDCDKSRGKHPRFKNWETAPLDLDALDRALASKHHYNIGIRTGLQPNGKA